MGCDVVPQVLPLEYGECHRFQAEGAYLRTRGLGPDFAKLWTANAVSNLGDGVTLVAGPLLAASLTRDPRLVAGLAVAQRLPWLLFSLLSGALVDRLDRRLLMVRVDAARAVAVGLLGVAVLADAATLPLLYAVFFALGTAETLFDNAAVSILPAVVPRDQLARANGRLLGARIVANELAAPPLGGLLFAAAAAVPFLLDAGSFAAAAALVAAMGGRFQVERPEGAPRTTLRGEIAEGIRWLARNRLLRLLAVAIALMNLTLSSALSLSVLYAQERLGLGSVGYGVLLSSMAVGGIAASLVADRVIGWLGPATTMRVGLIIESSTHLVLALTRSPLVAGTILTLFGFHAMTWSVISVSLRQELIPGRLLGRVNSAYALFGYGSMSLGAVGGGLLAARYGLTAPFWCSFAIMSLLTAVCWPLLSGRAIARARAQAAGEAPR
jgi:MFS family permease